MVVLHICIVGIPSRRMHNLCGVGLENRWVYHTSALSDSNGCAQPAESRDAVCTLASWRLFLGTLGGIGRTGVVCLVWCGMLGLIRLVWFSWLVWSRLVWFCLVGLLGLVVYAWFCFVWFVLVWFDLAWLNCLVWFGVLDLVGLFRFGWLVLVWFGFVWFACLVWLGLFGLPGLVCFHRFAYFCWKYYMFGVVGLLFFWFPAVIFWWSWRLEA